MNVILGLIVVTVSFLLAAATLMCLMIWEPGNRD